MQEPHVPTENILIQTEKSYRTQSVVSDVSELPQMRIPVRMVDEVMLESMLDLNGL